MITRSSLGRIAMLTVGVVLMLPFEASADAESCTQAHAAGQRAENTGHLKQALTSFQECASDASCPLPIRNECTTLYTTVEGRLPTLVFSVVDENGNDVTDVRVFSADDMLASGLDGRPIAVNPGLHELRLELPGDQVLTKSVVVRQGEKDRIVSVKLPRSQFGAEPGAVAGAEPLSSPRHEPKKGFSMPLASWVSYGVGVAALGSWGTFALLGRGQEQDLVECSPNCQSTRREDYDSMRRNYLIADISLGVAAAAVVAGTVVLFMGRRSKAPEERVTAFGPKHALTVSPTAMGRFGGGLVIEGRL